MAELTIEVICVNEGREEVHILTRNISTENHEGWSKFVTEWLGAHVTLGESTGNLCFLQKSKYRQSISKRGTKFLMQHQGPKIIEFTLGTVRQVSCKFINA